MHNESTPQIMQFMVSLLHIKPPIWRRLLVPSDCTLGQLHLAIQGAMGWSNSHLHSFVCGDTVYGFLDDEGADCKDENGVMLRDLFMRPKMKVRYEYDFGDFWEHDVVFEKIVEGKAGVLYPRCSGGKRACPPEDCGGFFGYEELCQLMANPKHPNFKEICEWYGGIYDPEEFRLVSANEVLQQFYKADRA
jgi:hypothetical protein